MGTKEDVMEERLLAELLSSVGDFNQRMDGDKTLKFYFSGDYLRGANLRDAHLDDSTFEDADLRGVDFRSANLRRAVFRNCDLRGARFEGAKLEGAEFFGSNLWGAVGIPDEELFQFLSCLANSLGMISKEERPLPAGFIRGFEKVRKARARKRS